MDSCTTTAIAPEVQECTLGGEREDEDRQLPCVL